MRLRRAVVLDEHECGRGADDELADEPVVGAGVPEDLAATVHVEDHRQRADGVRGVFERRRLGGAFLHEPAGRGDEERDLQHASDLFEVD